MRIFHLLENSNHFWVKLLSFLCFFFVAGWSFSDPVPERDIKDYLYKDSLSDSIELFKNFTLDFDYTPKPSDSMGTKPEKEAPFYFVVATKGKPLNWRSTNISTIAVYDHNGNLSHYLLDRAFNLYFSYINMEYKGLDGNVSKATFYNKDSVAVGYAEYRWIQKASGTYLIRESDLYYFHPRKKRFVRVENRFFIYKDGKALGKDVNTITQRTGNLVKTSFKHFQSTLYVARYTRYDENSQVQYRRRLEYRNDGKVSKINFYNKDNILEKTESFD